MARDFYPRQEGQIVGWAVNFSQKILAQPEHWNISPEQAAQYAVNVQEFLDARQTINDPAARTPVAMRRKERLKNELEDASRMLARLVRATPGITAAELSDLNLSTRPPGRGSRIGSPLVAPNVDILSITGRTVKLRLTEATELNFSRKPRGVAEALIFASVSDSAPEEMSAWTFMRNSSRTRLEVTFADPALKPGTKIWLCARWSSPRGEHGPISPPKFAHLGYEIAKAV